MTTAVAWEVVWFGVAAQLDSYRTVGLEALLTEDVLRFSPLQRLAGAGVATSRLEVEWRRAGVPDAVDLVVTSAPMSAVEFKFPREPRATNAAWTQHLGETLKDFYRLANMPADFDDRWCVQLLSRRVRRYFDGVADRHGVRLGSGPASTRCWTRRRCARCRRPRSGDSPGGCQTFRPSRPGASRSNRSGPT